MPTEQIIDRVIADLQKAGVVKESDRILTRHASVVRYANVIFDLDRAEAIKTVHGYLDDVGIALLRALRRLGLHVDRRELHQR